MSDRRFSLRIFLFSFFAIASIFPVQAQEPAPPEVKFPQDDPGLNSLPARKKAQMDALGQFKVFYQFHFTDQLKAERHHVP